jgi:hypothetical protein
MIRLLYTLTLILSTIASIDEDSVPKYYKFNYLTLSYEKPTIGE